MQTIQLLEKTRLLILSSTYVSLVQSTGITRLGSLLVLVSR